MLFYLHPRSSPLLSVSTVICFVYLQFMPRPYHLAFFPPRRSVILCFFAGSPLSNFRATLPPHALTMDTGAFNVGQWNKSERLPSPSHCIHPHSRFSFPSSQLKRYLGHIGNPLSEKGRKIIASALLEERVEAGWTLPFGSSDGGHL